MMSQEKMKESIIMFVMGEEAKEKEVKRLRDIEMLEKQILELKK
jgi:hypothetical protein